MAERRENDDNDDNDGKKRLDSSNFELCCVRVSLAKKEI